MKPIRVKGSDTLVEGFECEVCQIRVTGKAFDGEDLKEEQRGGVRHGSVGLTYAQREALYDDLNREMLTSFEISRKYDISYGTVRRHAALIGAGIREVDRAFMRSKRK